MIYLTSISRELSSRFDLPKGVSFDQGSSLFSFVSVQISDAVLACDAPWTASPLHLAVHPKSQTRMRIRTRSVLSVLRHHTISWKSWLLCLRFEILEFAVYKMEAAYREIITEYRAFLRSRRFQCEHAWHRDSHFVMAGTVVCSLEVGGSPESVAQ